MLPIIFVMACMIAPQARPQAVLLTESWENAGVIPVGWNTAVVSGTTNGITFVTAGSAGYPTAPAAFNGTWFIRYNSYSINSGGSTRIFRTAGTSTVGYAGTSVDFAMYHDPGYATNADNAAVQYSIDGGLSWTTAGAAVNRYDGSTGWKTHTVGLPANAGNQPDLRIAILFTSQYGNDCYVDLLHLNGIPLGMLTGVVTDANGVPVAGAVVTVAGYPPVITAANGLYIITGVPAGVVNVSVTSAGFVPWSGTAVITGGATTILNIALVSGVTIGGTITDISTGAPVEGAKIFIDTPSPSNPAITLTVAGGTYLTPPLSTTGAHILLISKTGYETYAGPVVLTPPGNLTVNMALYPTAVSPATGSAVPNNPSNPTSVNLGWDVPQGSYQLIYDDGGEENLAVWAAAGNLNAVKFTPLAWPVKLTGGTVDLGVAADYPPNALPVTTFTMIACKADGPGGTPGTRIDSTLVTATGFGWSDFTFASPLNIASGDFYLVMKQGGIPPHAAGVAVDLGSSQLRSYSRFVTGSGPWSPAAGNFMMRAIVTGTGGPMLSDNPATTPTYQVWRLQQGQENTPALWTSIWTGAVNSTVDYGWPGLPCGAYRWAVKAIYSPPGQRFSAPTFFNVIGKCWTAGVNVCVTLTCASNPKAGTVVRLVNNTVPDTIYSRTTDTSGCVHFANMWKGTYTMTVTRFTYPVYTQTVAVTGDVTLTVSLLQDTAPPTNLVVNPQSLHVTWSPPRSRQYHLAEDWSSGTFATNQWTTSGGNNWSVATGFGNPAPSAQFNWSPQVTGYNQFLTSNTMAGAHAPLVILEYDLFLSNFGTTTLNTMAVELWNGTNWSTLKTYDNQGGNINWKSETVDISSITNVPAFRIRFHAAGADTYDINNWNIDNIRLYSTDGTKGMNPCVVGYNFYIYPLMAAFTPDTSCFIPPGLVTYNIPYQACVKAVYNSGYSVPVCTPFTANYLYPVQNLVVQKVECSSYLTWLKPAVTNHLKGYNVYRENAVIKTIMSADTLWYYDYNLNPGLYHYDVKALYDLTAWGIATPPAPFGESLMNTAGIQGVTLTCGAPLPFYEPWEYDYLYHNWVFPAGASSHWSVNTSGGNPAPEVDFTWQPAITGYSQSITSEVIDPTNWSCAGLWLDFDVKLLDQNATGKEKLTVDLYYDAAWHQKLELASNGSTGWEKKHLSIQQVKGKPFRMRFTANGMNSSDIRHWYLDNIHAYGICNAPTHLQGWRELGQTHLQWHAPDCGPTGNGTITQFIFDDGTWENGWTMNAGQTGWFGNEFPVASSVTGMIQKITLYLVDNGTGSVQPLSVDLYDASHVLIGSSATFSGGPVNTWIDVPFANVPFSGEFFAMVKFGNLPAQAYYLASDENGQYASQDLAWNRSNTGVWVKASSMGANPAVFLCRATALVTGSLKQVELGPGLPAPPGLRSEVKTSRANTAGDSHDHSGMGPLQAGADSSVLSGYDIYRSDQSLTGPFHKVNPTLVTNTYYYDGPPVFLWCYYYVKAVMIDSYQNQYLCEAASDTLLVIWEGLNEPGGNRIAIFPNPATDRLNVSSDLPIDCLTVAGFTGQTLITLPGVASTHATIDLTPLAGGVYFVKVSTSKGEKIVKIAVIR